VEPNLDSICLFLKNQVFLWPITVFSALDISPTDRQYEYKADGKGWERREKTWFGRRFLKT